METHNLGRLQWDINRAWEGFLHINLARRVSSHHVQNRQLPTWVSVEPAVKLQCSSVRYDDGMSFCNEPFDRPSSKQPVFFHLLRCFFALRQGRRCRVTGSRPRSRRWSRQGRERTQWFLVTSARQSRAEQSGLVGEQARFSWGLEPAIPQLRSGRKTMGTRQCTTRLRTATGQSLRRRLRSLTDHVSAYGASGGVQSGEKCGYAMNPRQCSNGAGPGELSRS